MQMLKFKFEVVALHFFPSIVPARCRFGSWPKSSGVL